MNNYRYLGTLGILEALYVGAIAVFEYVYICTDTHLAHILEAGPLIQYIREVDIL